MYPQKNLVCQTIATLFCVSCIVSEAGRTDETSEKRRGPPTEFFLLRMPAVQKDLQLTDEQIQSLRDTIAETNERLRESVKKWRDLPSSHDHETRQIMQEAYRTALTTFGASLGENQQQRLKEITLQFRGMRAIAEPDVAHSLELTNGQLRRVKDMMQAEQESQRSLVESAEQEDATADIFRKFRELRKKTDAALMGILTAQQQQKLERMMGKRIDLGGTTIPMLPSDRP